MSKFSDTCKELIDANGTNVYQLGKISGLERSTLQRMVSGQRLPNIEFVLTFCKHLRIPSEEGKKLMEFYKMEQLGEGTYKNRHFIKNLINHIRELEDFPEQRLHTFKSNTCSPQVQHAVRRVLEKEFSENERPTIYTNIPCECTWFSDNLQVLFDTHRKKATVHHLFLFNINPLSQSNPTCNLEVLYYLLPFALSGMVEYHPYYYYSRISTGDFTAMIYPYYIITGNQVVEISKDFQSIITHTDSHINDIYLTEFKNLLSSASTLFQIYDTPLDAAQYYKEAILLDGGGSHYSLDFNPCVLHLCAFSDLIKNLQQINKEAFESLGLLTMDMTESATRNMEIFFTAEGTQNFIDFGHFSGQIALFNPALSQTECLAKLTQYLNMLKTQTRFGRMLSSDIKPPKHVNIGTTFKDQLYIIKLKEDEPFCICRIDESSICNAFIDFFSSLENFGFAHSADSTIEKLQHIIESNT